VVSRIHVTMRGAGGRRWGRASITGYPVAAPAGSPAPPVETEHVCKNTCPPQAPAPLAESQPDACEPREDVDLGDSCGGVAGGREISRRRRWRGGGTRSEHEEGVQGKSSQLAVREDPPEAPKRATDKTAAAELLAGDVPIDDSVAVASAMALRAASAEALGARFAKELFCPRFASLSHETKGDITSFGETTVVQTTKKLHRDFAAIAGGSAVYWPACVCPEKDLSLFQALYAELSPWHASPYKRSRHPACVEEERLLASGTYRHVVAMLRAVFGVKVGYSIVNLYTDGDDWTEYHRDNFRAEGNRMAAPGTAGTPVSAHNVTVGASFGASRELRFKHLQTELEFCFPQGNGDVFAFTEPVNSAFQHSVPRCTPASSAGPRISVILWGRVEDTASLCPRSSAAAAGLVARR